MSDSIFPTYSSVNNTSFLKNNDPISSNHNSNQESDSKMIEVINTYFETADVSDGGESPVHTDFEGSSDDSLSASSPPSMPLYPFQNQVGGHASLLRFSSRALLKPLLEHEKAMYEHFELNHCEILPYLSNYLGVLNVTFVKDSNSIVPVVLFEKNRHILPDDILKRVLGCKNLPKDDSCGSPGVTKINKKLQEQIFQEACSPQSLKGRIKSLSSKKRNACRPKKSKRRHSFSEANVEGTVKADNLSLKDVSNSDRLGTSFDSDRPPYDTSDEDSLSLKRENMLLPSQKFAASATATSKGVSVEDESFLFHMEDIHESLPSSTPPPLPSLPPSIPSTPQLNPWSMEIYRSTLEKMVDINSVNTVQQFLLLNDLTFKMHKPCILDLKMGTRQYGIYASKDKRDSQMRKCEKSTSKSLGVRVCGMQVYKSVEKKYIYHDKYFGRKLSAKAFRQSLVDYLHDGEKLLVHLLPPLVHKLRNLFDVIRSLRGYRFYASSLLLLYDGEPSSPLYKQIDIKIIDFANCVHNEMFCTELGKVGSVYPYPTFPPSTVGPDHGYLRGIATLLQEFAELWYLHASSEQQLLYHEEMLVEKEFPDAY